MSKEILKKIFNDEFICDKKHKLNTSEDYVINCRLLNTIENGITTEFLNTLETDVYYYKTQITIHGIFEDFFNPYLYKLIFQNKNKSIGVKYVALDLLKKQRIERCIRENGWHCKSSTSDFYFYKDERVKDENEAIEIAKRFKAEMERVNKELFTGNFDIYFWKSCLGGIFCSIELRINSILECNVSKVIEQLGGITEQEYKERRIKEREEYEKEQKEKEARITDRKEKFELLKSKFDFRAWKVRTLAEEGVYFYPCSYNDKDELLFKKVKLEKDKNTWYFSTSKPVVLSEITSVEFKKWDYKDEVVKTKVKDINKLVRMYYLYK